MFKFKKIDYRNAFVIGLFVVFISHHTILIANQVGNTFSSPIVKNLINYYRSIFNQENWYLFHKIPENFYRIEVRYRNRNTHFTEYKDYTGEDIVKHNQAIWGFTEKKVYLDRWLNHGLAAIYDIKKDKKIDENKRLKALPKITNYLKRYADGAEIAQWRLIKWKIASEDLSQKYDFHVRKYQTLIYESEEMPL
jgi:hypothetical protein